MRANAAFYFSYNNYGGYYRVRFNKTAARLFDRVNRVRISKNENYLIFTPFADESEDAFAVRRDQGGGILVCLNRAVSCGAIHQSQFDSVHYAVKRGSKSNKIYVCLKEAIDENQNERGT